MLCCMEPDISRADHDGPRRGTLPGPGDMGADARVHRALQQMGIANWLAAQYAATPSDLPDQTILERMESQTTT